MLPLLFISIALHFTLLHIISLLSDGRQRFRRRCRDFDVNAAADIYEATLMSTAMMIRPFAGAAMA